MNIGKDIPSYRGKKVFVGIDVHRRHYSVSCVCEGEIVKRFRVEALPSRLLSVLRKYFDGAKLFTVYEAGFSGFGLHRYLIQEGVNNIVVNPSSVEIGARDRVKTDKRDSLKQAVQLASGRLRSVYIPSEEQEQKRLITRSREQLVKEKTRLRNQIRFKLHHFGLMPLGHQVRLSKQFVEQCIEQGVSRELTNVLKAFLILWDSLDEQIAALDKELKYQAAVDPLESIYRSACGIGAITARTLSNELGDMSQFPNERALFSYTGLTPTEYSSGEKRRLGHISRQGNGRLRRVLTECAWTAIKQDPKLKADFERIAHRAGRKRAIVAIARKLVGRIRAALRKQELYEVGHGAATQPV